MSINWTQIEMLTLLEETAEESILQEMISIYETQMPEITQQIEAAIKADRIHRSIGICPQVEVVGRKSWILRRRGAMPYD